MSDLGIRRAVAVEKGVDIAERSLEDRFGEIRVEEMLDRKARSGYHPRTGDEAQQPATETAVNRQRIGHPSSPFSMDWAYYITNAV
jgi:hypothetical protein